MTSARTPHVLALTCSIAIVAAMVAGCGTDGSSKTGANTTPATATTSTAAPQSTVAPVTAATAPITVATVAPQTSAPSVETTGQAPTTDDASETSDATTDESTDTTSGTPPSTSATGATYASVSPPDLPSMTAAVKADNTHPDGVYYATVTEGGDPPPADGAVVFELVQLFVGADCAAHFGPEDEDSCVNDYGVETDPTSTLEVPLANQYITVADAATQDSYQITGAELYGLLHGDDPSAGAPADYLYSGFGYLVTISGGKVTRLEQWWTP